MSVMCLAISGDMASLFAPGKIEEARHVEINDLNECADSIKRGFGHDFRKKKLLVAANFEKTLIRVAPCRKRRTSSRDAWELLKCVFPFGATINEDSHVFDVGTFSSKYFLCGLPAGLSELLTKIGVELTGSIHYVVAIESVEHMIYRQELGDAANKLIVFPQENGFRLLFAQGGLPEDVFYVKNHPVRRLDELKNIIDTMGAWEYELKILPFGCESELILELIKSIRR